MAGYTGLLVCLDEMVNLYKLAHTQARNANYEQILRILNDSLQGSAAHLGFVLGGTPDFLLDTRRRLYSYAALQSRLAENTYATGGLVDHSGPVLRLANLSQEDFYLLLTRLRNVFAAGDPGAHLIPDEGITAFMAHCSTRIGDAYFRTPRTTIKEFVNLLAVLEQNPGTDWAPLVGAVTLEQESNSDLTPLPESESTGANPSAESPAAPGSPPAWSQPSAAGGGDDDLATFKL